MAEGPGTKQAWASWWRSGPWRASLIWGLLTALAAVTVLPMSLMLLMAFDAPGSTENPWLWLLLLGAFSFVPLCALVPLLLWLLYALGMGMPSRRRSIRRLGHGTHLLPFLSPLMMLLAAVGLQLTCGGQFVCTR